MELEHQHFQIYIDCDCGRKYLVVDLLRSKTPPTGPYRRVLKKVISKNLGRRFAESTDRTFVCPKCKVKVDIENGNDLRARGEFEPIV